MSPNRRLAAILAADVVGFSKLMEAAEAATLDALKRRRVEVLEPLVAKHRGRLFKLLGDGALIEFASAVNAVACAIELQTAMAAAQRQAPDDPAIVLRVGINLGDVIVEGSDLYGDGVNVAARLESAAGPGEIYLTETVHGQVRGKLPVAFEDLGEKSLKNISEAVRVYRVVALAGDAGLLSKQPAMDAKSIVVLPFLNMSGDAEQDYFSDGITEDIITDLSKISSLNIISRNTAFTFKGKTINVAQVARLLGVGLALEGSVRKVSGRVRITAQLIDAAKDRHIWAERYDRELTDIFAVQDEISQSIAAALKIRLLPEEKKALRARSTYNTDAYQLYLMGRHYLMLRGVRNLEIALRFARRAIALDAKYARAWALLGLCQSYLHLSGRSDDSGLPAAERALALDPNLAEAHAARGRVLSEAGRFPEALAAHEESLRLEPDSFDVRHNYGLTCMEAGRYEDTIRHLEQAAELLESDHTSLNLVALSHLALGHDDQYVATTRRALERIENEVRQRPDNANALVHGALALARLGETERAREWVTRALIIEPDDPMDQYNAACAWSQMREPEQALDILEACLPRMPAEFVIWLRQDVDLRNLHGNARFARLIQRCEQRQVAQASPGLAAG
jgi:adenylate cyclase